MITGTILKAKTECGTGTRQARIINWPGDSGICPRSPMPLSFFARMGLRPTGSTLVRSKALCETGRSRFRLQYRAARLVFSPRFYEAATQGIKDCAPRLCRVPAVPRRLKTRRAAPQTTIREIARSESLRSTRGTALSTQLCHELEVAHNCVEALAI